MGLSLVFCVDPAHKGSRLVFAFCLGALLVCAFWARLAPLKTLKIRRELPLFVRAGAPFAYTLSLTNASSRPLSRLDGRDGADFRQPDVAAWSRASWWADKAVGRFDRLVGYPRWLAMAEQTEDVAGERFALAQLAPHSTERLPAVGLCRQRGVRSFTGAWVGSRDPFNLWRALRWRPASDPLICLPASGPRLLSASAPGAGSGHQKKTNPHPAQQGEHLAGLRLWRASDGRRAIAWRASERAGTLLAREWSHPTDQSRALIVDPRLPQAASEFLARRLHEALLAAAFDWAQNQADVTLLFASEGRVQELRLGEETAAISRALALFAESAPLSAEAGARFLDEARAQAQNHAGGSFLACAQLDAAVRALAAKPGSSLSLLSLDMASLPAEAA